MRWVVLGLKPKILLWLTLFRVHGSYLPSVRLEERKLICSTVFGARARNDSGPVKINSAERTAGVVIKLIEVDMMKIPQGFGR